MLGVGGIFFKSPDPQKLNQWYAQWLGLPIELEAGVSFVSFHPHSMPKTGYTVWSAFESLTTYFAPSDKEFMFNLVVDDLEEALEQVKSGGAHVVGDAVKNDYGGFGWVWTPMGTRLNCGSRRTHRHRSGP